MGLLCALYLVGYEGLSGTQSLACVSRTGRRLWKHKTLAALAAALGLYALLALFTLGPYLLLWDYRGIWDSSVSSQFNYFVDMLYSPTLPHLGGLHGGELFFRHDCSWGRAGGGLYSHGGCGGPAHPAHLRGRHRRDGLLRPAAGPVLYAGQPGAVECLSAHNLFPGVPVACHQRLVYRIGTDGAGPLAGDGGSGSESAGVERDCSAGAETVWTKGCGVNGPAEMGTEKIWRPGLLLAIAFIGAVFSQSRTGFYLEYFSTSNDRGGTQVQLASGWLETYGNTIEPEERPGLDAQLAELEAEFAGQVAQIPGTAEAGITDYESYGAWEKAYNDRVRAEERTEEDSSLYWSIYYDTNLNMVESLLQFMQEYDSLAGGGIGAGLGRRN